MRKFLLFILLLFALQISAQEAYTKGDVFIDVQTGASFIGGIIGGGVHYGATPRFSVGANFSNQSFNLKSKYETAYVPELSVDFHFDHRMTTDWYTGLSIGHCFWQSDTPDGHSSGGCDSSSDPIPEKFRREHPSNFALWNVHLGFRYFIFKNVGLNGQVAFGNALSFKVGVSVKI